MAVVNLFRLRDGVAFQKAVFPSDYDVVGETMVDDDVASHHEITRYHWCKLDRPGSTTLYAMNIPPRDVPRKTRHLHRVVWEICNGPIPDGMTVDHKNMNGLDNRIENLRLATMRQQSYNCGRRKHNRSKYKGVEVKRDQPRTKPFLAKILFDRKTTWLGYYSIEEEAAFAHNIAAELCRGEFAWLNPIPPDSITSDRQQEIRSAVERKLRDRGLIPSET